MQRLDLTNATRFTRSRAAIASAGGAAAGNSPGSIGVGDQTVRFAPDVTRWLGIWLVSMLGLVENRRHRIAKTRQAGARLRRIISKYGVLPAATRNLQSAIVQGARLYAAELTWNRRRGVEGEYQQAINCMGRATLSHR